jgi:hypothetical protein
MARSARHAEQISARLVELLCAGRDGVSFPLGRRAQLALVLRVLARPTCDPGRPKSGSQRTRPWRETDSTLGPSPKDPLLAGEPKKASSGSSTPRMRLGPQGDRGAKPAPFYESVEANIPAASYCGMACPAGTCKTLTIFHDGSHGLSPGTDGSNPLPSSEASGANLPCGDQPGHGVFPRLSCLRPSLRGVNWHFAPFD